MKKVNNISVIRRLNAQLKTLKSFTQEVQKYLPEEWRDYCEVVRIDIPGKKIVISTSEQSLVTPLRFMQNPLLAHLKREFNALKGVSSIECIYTPLTLKRQREKRELLNSPSAAAACQEAATQCPPALKDALTKLGKTLRKET
ncbi:MAG: hypothetical protein K0S08_2082 [Gammaproteobacteria bacterium]|jgi:hypothetical protein|nr:hypothetical protein [Gammaproteobacteria bacterium]